MAAWFSLRIYKPHLDRPFRIPIRSNFLLFLFFVLPCLITGGIVLVLMCLESSSTLLLNLIGLLIGFFIFPLYERIIQKKKKGEEDKEENDILYINYYYLNEEGEEEGRGGGRRNNEPKVPITPFIS